MKNLIMYSLATFSFSLFTLKAQTISTFAGDGIAGYNGDNGQATDAELNYPVDVAFDINGNLYVADRTNNVVREINSSGIITTIAGNGMAGFSGDGGRATAAEISDPVGVLIDSVGNMYISDDGNERIRKVNTAGIITTFAGNGVTGFSGDGGQATAAEMSTPGIGFAMDNRGYLFFADDGNNVIRRIDTVGIITTVVGNFLYGRGYYGDGGQATAAELWGPESVALDGNGNIFIGDANNNVVRKVNTSGIISTIAGNNHYGFSGDGGPATAAELKGPCGITFDASDNMYFADEINNRIRMVNTSGIINTVAGGGTSGLGDGGPATAAELNLASAVAFDVSGNMFIADEYSNRVREVTGIYTGINKQNTTDNGISIYPNPTNKLLFFNILGLKAGGSATLSIMDITGRELLTCPLLPNTTQIQVDVSELRPGMYLLNVKNKRMSVTQKFIKQ